MPSIRIANGLLFDPWKPEMGFISTEGSWNWLGHHLANECRYAGGCKWFYSVAQHSVLASRYLFCGADPLYYDKKMRLAALLHDATEATLKDIPGPYKHSAGWGGYRSVEESLGRWIYAQFGLGEEFLNAPPIKAIDKELLHAERFKLFPGCGYMYSGTIVVEPWDREYARDEFNRTLRDLTRA